MSLNVRLFITIVTALLFVILVFMNFLGYWKAHSAIQILFFLYYGSIYYQCGYSKNLKNRS